MKKNNFGKYALGTLGTALGAAFAGVDKANAQEWTANSVDEIEQAIAEDKETLGADSYTIRWGDYLSGIAVATSIPQDTLAQINDIKNHDLIYAGDILHYGTDGTVVVENGQTGDIEIYESNEKDGKNVVNKVEVDDLSDDKKSELTNKHPNLSDKLGTKPSEKEDDKSDDGKEVVEDVEKPDDVDETEGGTTEEVEKEEVIEGGEVPVDVDETEGESTEEVVEEDVDEETGTVIRTVTVTTPINRGIEYVADENRPTGEETILEEGKDGEIVQVFERTFVDGELVEEVLISEDRTDAVNKVVQIGTAPVVKETIKRTTVIEHAVKHVETDELLVGETEVVQEGSDGSRIETVERTVFNDEVLDEVVVDVEEIAATDRIIHVGTKVAEEPVVPEEPEEPEDEVKIIHESRVNEDGLVTPNVYEDGRIVFEGNAGNDITNANEWGKALQFAQMEATWLDPSLPGYLNQVHGYGSRGIYDGFDVVGAEFFFYRKADNGEQISIDVLNDEVYYNLALQNDLF